MIKLFDPFATTKTDNSNCGLGLYAARSLVVENGGTLDIQNRPDRGTIATIDFPAVFTNENGAENHIPEQNQENNLVEFSKQVFLIVDDDEAMRELLHSHLQRRGHIVFCVESCKEALEEFTHLADLVTTILVDIGLRDATGYECVKELRLINNQVKIIFMSGQDLDGSEGRDPTIKFLKKPFSIQQVEQMVQNVSL